MLEQIATGGSASLLAVGGYDNLIAEGQTGELRIEMSSIPPGLTASIRSALERTPGFDLLGVHQEGGGAGSFVLSGLATLGDTAIDIFTGGLFGIPDIPKPVGAPGAIIIRFPAPGDRLGAISGRNRRPGASCDGRRRCGGR